MSKRQSTPINRSEIGRKARESGYEFEKKVADLLKLQGYEVELNVEKEGTEQDIIARFGKGTFIARKKGDIRYIIQCKKIRKKIGKTDIKDFNVNIAHARMDDECDRGLMVSEFGYVKTTQELRNKHNFIEFKTYDELLAEGINFTTYLQKLVAAVDEAPENAPDDPPLSKHYIPIKAEIKSTQLLPGKHFDSITEFVKSWVNRSDPKEPHPVILGSYGTGKTTFCKKFVRDMANDFIKAENKVGLRIPILFDLRHFTKEMEIESLVIHHLDEVCAVGARYELFARMNKAGLFLLIFDGFDEMATKVTSDVIQTNILEINKLAVHKRSKVLLTSRPEHFISEEEEAETLGKCEDPLKIQHRPFQRINLLPLEPEQIETYLKNRVPYIKEAKKKWTYYRDEIKEIHDLTDLSRRPVLLEMIVKTLPGLVKQHEEEGIEINRPNLYQRYLNGELDRQLILKKRKLLLNRENRLKMLQKFALHFFLGETTSISFEDAEEIILKTIAPPMSELEAYTRDFLTCSFLIRVAGSHRFSHNSIWEYLTAKELSKEIEGYEKGDLSSFNSFGKQLLTPIICDFLSEMNPSEKKLWNIILETRKKLPEGITYIGSNACSILNHMKATFQNVDLSYTNLKGTSFCSCDLTNANLSGANIKNAIFSNTNLRNANLSKADLTGVHLVSFNCKNYRESKILNCVGIILTDAIGISIENKRALEAGRPPSRYFHAYI